MAEVSGDSRIAELRRAFTDACRNGDLYGARRHARELLAVQGTSRTLRFIVKGVEESRTKMIGAKAAKVAVLSSYSAEFLADALHCAAFLRGVIIEIYQPGFNQFRQEIIDPKSGLYRFAPDVVILSVLGEALCPALYDAVPAEVTEHVSEITADFKALLSAFREKSSSALFVQTLLPPLHPVFGVGDANLSFGQRAQARRVNAGLVDLCREYPGVFLIDYEALVGRYGAKGWHDERMRHFAQLPIDKQMFMPLADEYAKAINILKGGAKKCVVVDLDNTLWGGIVGEDGVDGIKLDTVYPGSAYRAFQRALASLADRGVLLAIASKNNPADVAEVFEKHPHMVLTKDHFAASQIGWQPKSESIKAIAQELSIGLEHMVLVDDNPAECAEVAQALPMVTTLQFPRNPEEFAEVLAGEGLFDVLQFSAEDLKRTQLYKQRAAAEAARTGARNLDEFYRSLDMEIRIDPVNASNISRASQLTQKTNQLNLTTYRYNEADIQARTDDAAWHCRVVTVRDRFGDHGIIGVLMAHHTGGKLVLDTFLLSCRVIGRSVETAMLAHLSDVALSYGARYIDASLIPTAKNVPVRSVLPDHGFEKVGDRDAATEWRLDVTARRVPWPAWFRVHSPLSAVGSP